MIVQNWRDFVSRESNGGRPVRLSIGVFDGLHLGHVALLDHIIRGSGEGEPWVLTFAAHPERVLQPGRYAGDLMSLEQKLETLDRIGVHRTVIIDFSEEFGTLSGTEFLETVRGRCRLVRLAVGADFHCGKGMDTSAVSARQLLEPRGVEVVIVPHLRREGTVVSSTGIRQFIKTGDLCRAERFLGRPYEFEIPEGKAGRCGRSDLNQVLPDGGRYRVHIQGGAVHPGELVIDGSLVRWNPASSDSRKIRFLCAEDANQTKEY